MIIPSGGCDAMHMAANFDVLRREHDRLALALERANADAANMECLRDMASRERDAMAKRLVEAEKELAAMKAERDVLLRIVQTGIDACDHCKHAGTFLEDTCPEDFTCTECPKRQDCVCGRCKGGSEFEFVGIEEDSK